MGVPVNQHVAVREEKALKLRDGLRMVVGQRLTDGALLAKLLVFREPEFSINDAETAVARWGYPMAELQPEDEPPAQDPEEEQASAEGQPLIVNIEGGGDSPRVGKFRLTRGANGELTGVEAVEPDAD